MKCKYNNYPIGLAKMVNNGKDIHLRTDSFFEVNFETELQMQTAVQN